MVPWMIRSSSQVLSVPCFAAPGRESAAKVASPVHTMPRISCSHGPNYKVSVLELTSIRYYLLWVVSERGTNRAMRITKRNVIDAESIGSGALLEAVMAHGVDTIFGLPGGQLD